MCIPVYLTIRSDEHVVPSCGGRDRIEVDGGYATTGHAYGHMATVAGYSARLDVDHTGSERCRDDRVDGVASLGKNPPTDFSAFSLPYHDACS
jgi:hypothetical protein